MPPRKALGRFISFEGVEGSGKTTQLLELATALTAVGIAHLVVREPGGTDLAERVRAIFLDPSLSPNPVTETFLLEAARADLVEKVIRPALSEGRWVLCDRYSDSTLAYQGAGRRLGLDDLRILNGIATQGLRPNRTFLLDLDPMSGLSRKFSSRAEIHRLELENIEFHQRVWKCFRILAAEEPGRFVVLDARLAPSALHAMIVQSLGLGSYARGTRRGGVGRASR